MKIKVENYEYLKLELPKYFESHINLAGEHSQGVRKQNINYLRGMFKEFIKGRNKKTITMSNWKKWYIKNCRTGVAVATTLICNQMLKEAREVYETETLPQRTKTFVKIWVENLIFNQTFNGLIAEFGVFKEVAKTTKNKYSVSTMEEDGKGIDGYIGDKSVSVKPNSFCRNGGIAKKRIVYTPDKNEKGVINIELR